MNGLTEDADGNPRYCLICRPHLARDRRRYRAGLDDYPQPEEMQ